MKCNKNLQLQNLRFRDSEFAQRHDPTKPRPKKSFSDQLCGAQLEARELNLFIPPFSAGIVFHGRCVSQSWNAGKDYDDVMMLLFFFEFSF